MSFSEKQLMQERSDLNQLLLEMKDQCNALAAERDRYRDYNSEVDCGRGAEPGAVLYLGRRTEIII